MAQFNEKATVTIACDTMDSTIKYTVDGTAPSASAGTIYSAPFTLYKNATVKAIGISSGLINSDIATESITIKLPNKESYYTVTTSTDNAKIKFNAGLAEKYGSTCKCRYTIKGSNPTEETENILDDDYTLTLHSNCTFKAIITADNNVNSDIVSFVFTTLKVQTPVITVV